MKISKLLGWAFMALACITSCSDDTDVLTQESEIKLTSEVITSRVTSLDYQATQIVEGQQVGVTITGAKAEHNNVAWNVGENGVLSNTGDKVYYGADDATITAYHPYNSAWTGTSHEFSVSTDQTSEENFRNSDLLWATTTSSKTDDVVSLGFTHKLAKINVTLGSEESDMDLTGAVISICNTKVSTTFNPTTGEFMDATGIPKEIKASVTTAEAKTASAMVVPQTVNSGSQFIKIALGDKIFYYTLPADKVLKSGYSHNYTLIIKERKVEVKGESVISDWTDEGNVGDAEEVKTLLLPDGPTFNKTVGEYLTANTNLTKIKFVANSNTTSESVLVTDEDGTKGYLVANEEWLEIHTSASEFVANANSEGMFHSQSTSPFSRLTNIGFGDNFNTSNVTDMTGMFYECRSLTSLDLSTFDTSNVTDMTSMFFECRGLTSLDLRSFNTSNVRSMYSMFVVCESLTSLDVSSFVTSKTTDMRSMFDHCTALTSLDVSSFDTSNVTQMGSMFNDCNSLISLDLRSFDTSNVTHMGSMFNDCNSLISLDLRSFDTSNVTHMGNMFSECRSLTSLDLSNFSFDQTPSVSLMLQNVGVGVVDNPIPVKVTEEGYTYLTETTTDCGIGATAKFVKTDGTDWVTE